MTQLKDISQCLTGCFSFFQDALNKLEQLQDNGEINSDVSNAISDKIFCAIEELDYCELFVKRLSKCKNESDMEAIVNADKEEE